MYVYIYVYIFLGSYTSLPSYQSAYLLLYAAHVQEQKHVHAERCTAKSMCSSSHVRDSDFRGNGAFEQETGGDGSWSPSQYTVMFKRVTETCAVERPNAISWSSCKKNGCLNAWADYPWSSPCRAQSKPPCPTAVRIDIDSHLSPYSTCTST